jgi:hypothetical protein
MSTEVSEKAMKSMIETMINAVDPEQVKTLAKTFDIPTINVWLKHCQENAKKGSKHGYVHQDLVNLLGEKLGFQVTYGKYTSGYDGIWKYDSLSIIVESKANIQWKGTLQETMTFVSEEKADYGLVVSSGFDDEDLNTVKGPSYSSKLRLITTDALCKLASLKHEGVLTTENVKDILIPQESHLLDGIIDLIYGLKEQVSKPKPTETEVSLEEQKQLSEVPESIKKYGDISKAMYLILKQNPNRWFEASELVEEIKKTFPKTFSRMESPIGWAFPFGGMWLEKKGFIEIKKDEYGNRSYKFKLERG